MTDTMTKAVLTPARRHLVEMMQEINYGRLEGLQVRDGDPLIDPPPTATRSFLFGRTNGPNRSREKKDFSLKKALADLFEIFDREQSLSIQELIIEDGLPIRMTVADKGKV